MSRLLVEIRAAEGGADAKSLVGEQLSVYAKACQLRGLTLSTVEERPGFVALEIVGPDVDKVFAAEPGGHRWQRVPPNERRGRRHTSTVTVAVLPIRADAEVAMKDEDLEWSAVRGSGAGGQHRNVTDSAVVMRHIPTGLTVRIEAERSQLQNRTTARRILGARVQAKRLAEREQETADDRRAQVGSGMRGDKIRTVRMQDGRVVDHQTGLRTTLERYRAGHLEDVSDTAA